MKTNTPKWIIIHHEGAYNGFESVDRTHRNNPNVWLGHYSELGHAMGYQHYMDTKGKVTQARLDREEGAHTRGMNRSSLGICLMGNFNKYDPTEAQEVSLKKYIIFYMKKYNIPLKRVVPHRFFSKTDCYGTRLSDSWAMDLVKAEDLKPNNKQIKLFKKKIGIIEKMIQIYVALKALYEESRKSNK